MERTKPDIRSEIIQQFQHTTYRNIEKVLFYMFGIYEPEPEPSNIHYFFVLSFGTELTIIIYVFRAIFNTNFLLHLK